MKETEKHLEHLLSPPDVTHEFILKLIAISLFLRVFITREKTCKLAVVEDLARTG